MTLKPLDLNSLIKQVVYPLSLLLREEVSLRMDLARQELRVLADCQHMGDVLGSLVYYGIDVASEGDIITISTRLLPVETSVKNGGARARLNYHNSKGRRNTHMFYRIRMIVKKHNGLIRIRNLEGRKRCNIYLPLLHFRPRFQEGHEISFTITTIEQRQIAL